MAWKKKDMGKERQLDLKCGNGQGLWVKPQSLGQGYQPNIEAQRKDRYKCIQNIESTKNGNLAQTLPHVARNQAIPRPSNQSNDQGSHPPEL